MSYQLLSSTEPKARKPYRCEWCPEWILKGDVHVHEVSKFDGDLQDMRLHKECYEAAKIYFIESNEDTFEPHACKRGTNDQA